MTWRRFIALLGGLSLQSRWAASIHADADPDGTTEINDPAAAEAWFAGLR
jgi:hypothetical protein